jgi:hypothetical protein
MAQIAQAGGAVDRWADVVALVAQLDLARVDTDTQADRGQRRPLQCERARHRVAGARERQHEAVALTLLDRPNTAMGRDETRQRVIQPRDCRAHLVGLGLPQPRGALDVG